MDMRYECWQMPNFAWATVWGYFKPHYFEVMRMTHHLAGHLAQA